MEATKSIRSDDDCLFWPRYSFSIVPPDRGGCRLRMASSPTRILRVESNSLAFEGVKIVSLATKSKRSQVWKKTGDPKYIENHFQHPEVPRIRVESFSAIFEAIPVRQRIESFVKLMDIFCPSISEFTRKYCIFISSSTREKYSCKQT